MTFDEMTAEYATYVQDERDQEAYARLLDHMVQAVSDDAAESFHVRTIARLQGMTDPIVPAVQPSDDATE